MKNASASPASFFHGKLYQVLFALLGMLISTLTTSQAKAQVYGLNTLLSSIGNMGFVPEDRWTTSLEESESASTIVALDANHQYAFVAYSTDSDVRDVDIEVQDMYGNVLREDAGLDAIARVYYSPNYDRRVRVRVLNYSSDTPDYASPVIIRMFKR